jgi:asparagine synthase (glutamine-hydrolysing)
VRTISVGFDRPEFDETATAAEYARELGTDHLTVRVTAADILADFDRVLAAADQPTVDGFNTYYVCRAARQAGLTVALSGLGGDELFGGYRSFRDVPRAARVLRLARYGRRAGPMVAAVARRVKSRGLLKFAEALGRPTDPVSLYLLRREVFAPADRRALAPLPPGSDPLAGVGEAYVADWRSEVVGLDPENQVSALEMTAYMRHMLLRDADVFSMAHGLELRVPLLDHEFVDAATALPGAWKRPGKVPKPLLVEAAGARLPAAVTRQPKRGFTFPWAEWFRGPLASAAGDRLTDRAVWDRLGFDPATPGRLWERFRRGDPAVGGVHVLGLVGLADLAARQRLSVR